MHTLISRLFSTLLFSTFVFSSAFFTAARAGDDLTLVYSGNLDGELEPCGCTIDTDFGGILRRASWLDDTRQQQPQLVLISSGGLFLEEMGGDSIKNKHILSGLAQLDYDAIGIQWPDLSLGAELLTRSGLPFTAGNWKSDSVPLSRTITRGERQLFYSQWLDPERSPYQAMPGLSPVSASPAPLQQALAAARAAGQLTILATTLSSDQAGKLFDLSVVDILIIRSAYEQYGEPVMSEGTLVLQPGSRGQRLGRLQLALTADNRIQGWQHEVVELANTIRDAERLKGWYDSYNETLRRAFEEEIKEQQARDKGDTPYVSAQVCAACHQTTHQGWENSDHAMAYDDLEEVGKGFDPHCVSCHVVGYRKPGGFLSVTLTPQLAGVQCENCHGAGREHASSAGTVPTPNRELPREQICSQCHVSDHSPKFRFDDYWPKISHGREGAATP